MTTTVRVGDPDPTADPWVLGCEPMGLTAAAWTDSMVAEGRATGVNRQCSIGWHEECSDPDGDRCRCRCHVA